MFSAGVLNDQSAPLGRGQTEEAFVNRVCAPTSIRPGCNVARPSLLRTKELPEGKPYKGGVTT